MWYEKSRRRLILDMHIEDWDKSFLADFDPEKVFYLMKKGGVTAPVLYVQSHVGLCYWPTRSGVMHKAFVGKEDQMKKLFDLCIADGMTPVLYYSFIFNNKEYDRHPEWRIIDGNGYGSRDHGGRYGVLCPNNEEYKEFCKTQIKEFCEYFEFSGVFFDMTFWPSVCYCPECQKKWKERYEGEIPKTVDWKDPAWLQLDELRRQQMREFAFMLTNEVKKYKPGVSVEHQYGNSLAFWRYGNDENVSEASDYIGTDLYGGIREQSMACKAWYHLTQNQPFQYITSRCYPDLFDHTTMKTIDQLRQCVAMTYLHHGAPMLIDAIDLTGTLDERVYDKVGKVYREMAQYEPYVMTGTLAYDVSLFLNLKGKMDVRAKPYSVMSKEVRLNNSVAGRAPHIEALQNTSDALSEAHIPYTIVNNWKPCGMDKGQVVVISDAPFMSSENVEYIINYVKNGGSAYLSGITDEKFLKEFFGAIPEGVTEEKITYLSPTEKGTFMTEYVTAKYPLIVHEKAVKISEWKEGVTIYAWLTIPYTIPGIKASMFATDIDESEFISQDNPAYQFAAIRSDPPGKVTTYPGIIGTTYGKGRVIWSALPFERENIYQHKKIFAEIIRYLATDSFKFYIEAPASVEGIMFSDDSTILLGLIETRAEWEITDVRDIKIRIPINERPKSVYTVPDKRQLLYEWNGKEVEFQIDKLSIHCMIKIDL